MKTLKFILGVFVLLLAITLPMACSNDDGPGEQPFVDTEAEYTVADAKEVGAYVVGETLATVSDTNGGITSATLQSGFILPPGTALDPGTGRITVSDPALLVPGSYQIGITTVDAMDETTMHSITLTFDENLLPLNINSGGGEISYMDVSFRADTFFVGSSTTFTAVSDPEIANTEMDEIYRTERFANPGSDFGYEVELPNGNYTVILHFAEIFWGTQDGEPGGVGSRVFDVAIEGVSVIEDYDIFDEVGTNSAVVREFNISVDDGMLNIDFSASVNNGKISAIQIFETP